jgi:hypothetical protein
VRHIFIFVGILLLAFVAFHLVKKSSSPDGLKPVPTEVIELAKKRLPLLQADMNSQQVLTTLGLSNYWWDAEGGGPASHFWTTYDIGNGHHLYLVYDVPMKTLSSTNAQHKLTLLSASVDGEAWKPIIISR